jgi:hypothetical protein
MGGNGPVFEAYVAVVADFMVEIFELSMTEEQLLDAVPAAPVFASWRMTCIIARTECMCYTRANRYH